MSKKNDLDWRQALDKLMIYKVNNIEREDVCPLEYDLISNNRIRKINHKYKMIDLKVRAIHRKCLGLYRTHSRVKIKKKK